METIPFAEAPISEAGTASLRGIYLERLQRLLRLRQQHCQDLNGQGIHLLDRSIFAAYCDCRDLGAGRKAHDILREANFAVDQHPDPLGMVDAGSSGRPEASSRGSARGAQPKA